MKLLLIIILSLSANALASLPELFGPSAGSIAIGGQAQMESASNNYQAPALLGYSKKPQFSFNMFYINTNFKSINNVVTKNETNTVNKFKKSDAEVNPTPTMMLGAHISTPLFSPEGLKFNVSFFAPFDRLMESDSGDPYQPKYVMYESRILRPVIIFTGSQNFGDWSYSAGVHTGFQTNGETYFMTRTTSGNPSMAKMSFNAKPSVAAIASVAKKTKNHTTYLTFQQEMKSKLTNRASGETETSSNASFPFDFDIEAMMYYDPTTIRLGHQIHHEDNNLFFSLDFQQWDRYEGSNLKIKKRGGQINGSKDYERLKLKNLFIPRIGFEKNISERWIAKVGYFYRQSPIYTNNLKYSGNTIDVDKHVASLGAAHLFKIYDKVVTLDLAYQAHFLRSMSITKTPNREDGSAAEPKIGSPGYKVGGMIHVVSLGLSWMY